MDTTTTTSTADSTANVGKVIDTLKQAKTKGTEIVKGDINLIKEKGIAATPISVVIGGVLGAGLAFHRKSGLIGYAGYIALFASLGAIAGYYYDKKTEATPAVAG